MFPEILTFVKEAGDAVKLKSVNVPKFKTLKERILALDYLLVENAHMSDEHRAEFVVDVLDNGIQKESSSHGGAWVIKAAIKFVESFVSADSAQPPKPIVDVPKSVLDVDDRLFLSRLNIIADRFPLLASATTQAADHAQQYFEDTVEKETKSLLTKIQSAQRKGLKEQITRKVDVERKEKQEQLRVQVLKALASGMPSTSAR